MNPARLVTTLLLAVLCSASMAAEPVTDSAGKPPGSGPVKVYILAGQSNMEGKAKMSLVDYQAGQPLTAELFRHWRRGEQWIERDDVWIKFLDRQGRLTVGYGSPGCIGPELEFGAVVGDRSESPVLLIKTAWGGRSLYRDFRPPSARLPDEAVLQRMLDDERRQNPAATLDDVRARFGKAYREMFDEIHDTLHHLAERFPALDGREYELSGFVWLQGWNDMISADYTAEYTANLAHFIRDVRRDLKSPRLPFVIGQMGVDGDLPSEGIQRFKNAQAAVLDLPEFQNGGVTLVATDQYWDTEAEAVFKKGWREHLDEWNKVGSDYPYHYLGSPRTMLGMGRGFAEAVIQMEN
ncbi:MAG: sialate O-acetylesterase [Pirellulales bacterium]